MKIDAQFLAPADAAGREKMKNRILEKHPQAICQTVGKSILTRDLDVFYIGSGRKYIVIVAAHHALESIGANVAYIFVDYLLSKLRFGSVNSIDCKTLLSKYCFVTLPCINPDGIEMRYHGVERTPLYDRQMRMSKGDFSTWQANARGVDLNHNYDFRFSEYKRLEVELGISAGPRLFAGESAESEPETRAVANLVRTLMPHAVVSLHSQGEEIYAFPDSPRGQRIGQRLANLTGYTLSHPESTAAYTGLCDYTASLGIPSFTLELGKGVNPLPESDIPAIFERVGDALVTLPTLI